MTMITNKGIYISKPVAWSIDAEDGKCPQFVCLFECSQVKDGPDWVPAEGQITGYFNLVKKDQSLNEINVRGLKDSLGWDGTSFDTLENGDWSKTEVQIVVDEDEYNGKTRLRVQYINPRDYAGPGGSVQKSDPAKVKSLDTKYGATLRALFGTKPAAGGKPTPGKGKAGTATATAPSPSAVDAAKSRAWVALKDKTASMTSEERTAKFKEIAAELYPAKEPKNLDAGDWDDIATQITNSYDGATGELIPF